MQPDTIVVDDNIDVRLDPWLTFGPLHLYDSDRESLLNGEWLNDAHLSAVQYFLKE